MGRTGRNAEITALLSIVFILLVSFVLGILEISVIHTYKNMSRLSVDRSIFSVFGEYQKELLEDYHVFAVDGSYGTGDFSENRLTGRMHYYGSGNTAEHEVSSIRYLTDSEGQSFREQVLACMEKRYGISLIREFTGMTSEWEEQEIRGESMRGKEEEILDDFEELKSAADSEETDVQGSIDEMNPFTCLEQIEKSGILSIVMPEEMELSGLQIIQEEQASVRALQTGRGMFPVRQGMDGPEEKLLFNEYVMKNFSNAAMDPENYPGNAEEQKSTENDGDTDQGRSLEYEIEYIISGKMSDKENLESVLMRIFLIRMALNYAYILTDTSRQSEASTLAAVITAILLVPQLSEGLKQLILLAWSAGESIVDLRTLLAGKRAPLVKNAENWQLSLAELFTLGLGSEKKGGEDNEEGITYEQYLRAFLFLENPGTVTMRTIDRIEENLSSDHGLTRLKADHCVTGLEIQNTVKIFGDISYEFPASFVYK